MPKWPTQIWWPSLLALGGTHIDLPLPKFCVRALHTHTSVGTKLLPLCYLSTL